MRSNVVPTLQELISFESDLHSDMGPVLGYVSGRLKDAGMKVRRVGKEDFPVIIATYSRGGMLFSGHLDTVPVGTGWSREQGEIDGPRLYGRGSTDMKGFGAAVIEAAEDLVKEKVPFSVCFTTDEEEQMEGVDAAVQESVVKNAKGVLVGEPTGLAPAYREKGLFRFRLTTKGRAAHASQPWLGDDAVLKMHYLIDRLLDLAEISTQKSTGMTLCVTTIQGGDKNNVVADHCTAEVDMRFPLPQTSLDVQDIVVNRLRGEAFQMQVEYTIEAFESDPRSEIGAELARFLGTEPTVVPYATEAPKFAAVNPNVFICGPGDPKLAHTIDEHVLIRELEEAYDMITHIARYVQG